MTAQQKGGSTNAASFYRISGCVAGWRSYGQEAASWGLYGSGVGERVPNSQPQLHAEPSSPAPKPESTLAFTRTKVQMLDITYTSNWLTGPTLNRWVGNVACRAQRQLGKRKLDLAHFWLHIGLFFLLLLCQDAFPPSNPHSRERCGAIPAHFAVSC